MNLLAHQQHDLLFTDLVIAGDIVHKNIVVGDKNAIDAGRIGGFSELAVCGIPVGISGVVMDVQDEFLHARYVFYLLLGPRCGIIFQIFRRSTVQLVNYFDIALIITSAALITSVILQNKGVGLGGLTGQDSSGVFTARRGIERTLFISTIVLSVLFFILTLITVYIK